MRLLRSISHSAGTPIAGMSCQAMPSECAASPPCDVPAPTPATCGDGSTPYCRANAWRPARNVGVQCPAERVAGAHRHVELAFQVCCNGGEDIAPPSAHAAVPPQARSASCLASATLASRARLLLFCTPVGPNTPCHGFRWKMPRFNIRWRCGYSTQGIPESEQTTYAR